MLFKFFSEKKEILKKNCETIFKRNFKKRVKKMYRIRVLFIVGTIYVYFNYTCTSSNFKIHRTSSELQLHDCQFFGK